MAGIELNHYVEAHPHRLKRIIWAVLNVSLYPLLPSWGRNVLLRMFGAKFGRSVIYRSTRIFAPWNLTVGDYSCIGPHVEIYSKGSVKIGSHTVISQDSYICTASHDVSSKTMAPITKPITIGDSAWLAAKAVVLPGITIGEGAVVGCAAVVTKDVAPWTVVGGNPAREIKKRVLKN